MAGKKQRTAADWDKLSPSYRRRMERTIGRDKWISDGPTASARGQGIRELSTKLGLPNRYKGWDRLTTKEKSKLIKDYETGFLRAGKFSQLTPEQKAPVITARNAYQQQLARLESMTYTKAITESWTQFRDDYQMTFGKKV